MLFVAVGYEVFALLPPFAKNYAGVDERWIGFIWLANTLLIVLIQLPVSKALEGRRRMAALALMNVLWAAASLIVLAGGGLLNGTSAALVFMSATMVFAVGETLQGPTQAPLVADLAPERLRGRYFALSAMSWSAGSILGPAVGGPLLGWHPLAVWPISAGVCLFAAMGCLRLERTPAGTRPPHAEAGARPADAASAAARLGHRAPVAQGIERAPPEREVAGSIPARRIRRFVGREPDTPLFFTWKDCRPASPEESCPAPALTDALRCPEPCAVLDGRSGRGSRAASPFCRSGSPWPSDPCRYTMSSPLMRRQNLANRRSPV